MTNEIPKELIQASLALCGKSIDDFMTNKRNYFTHPDGKVIERSVHYESFFYYLLSPEFIEKYWSKIHWIKRGDVIHTFWKAIYEYQRRDETYPEWNKKPLIELLSKICHLKSTYPTASATT